MHTYLNVIKKNSINKNISEIILWQCALTPPEPQTLNFTTGMVEKGFLGLVVKIRQVAHL